MGLSQRIVRKSHFFLILLISTFPLNVFAGWSSPQQIIQGVWGSGDNQFGITNDDTSDLIPNFNLTTDQKIVIRDGTNRRVKVYDSLGALVLIVPYKTNLSYKDLTIADSYGFSGDFIGYGSGGTNYFYRADQKLFIAYSSTGQLIKTLTTRPAELGTVIDKSLGNGQYKITVTYPDEVWSYNDIGPMAAYIRDKNGNLYGYGDTQAARYTACGKVLALLTMPEEKTSEKSWGPQIEPQITVLEEYGSPVIAPNGDVYTWKRTPDNYSILKWTWVDDPTVQTGPDAPTNLTIMPSLNGLYLTWAASPQDPGCVTGYEIDQATTSGGPYTVLTTVNSGVLKYNDTSAVAAATYFYKIRAVSGTNYSPYTSEVSGKR